MEPVESTTSTARRRAHVGTAVDSARLQILRLAKSGAGVITGLWVVSRILAYVAGVGFDARLLTIAQHLLDVDLLKHDPFASILYLHSQPPLFNVVTAIALRLPHDLVTPGLSFAWHALGLATALVTYRVIVRTGARTWLAVAMVGLLVISPTAILFESWFFYSQLQMFLVALVLLGAARFAEHQRFGDGLLFSGAFAGLVLLRSVYPVWLIVLFFGLVWFLLRMDARKIVAIVAIPLLLALAWNVKNVVIFDRFGSSSWQGMSLWRIASAGVPAQRIAELQREDKIDVEVGPFGPPSWYRNIRPDTYGVAATDQLYKRNGATNFNAALYLKVSDRFQSDALTVLRDGGVHGIARAELASYALWNQPGDGYFRRSPDYHAIDGYTHWFDRLVMLRVRGSDYGDPGRFSVNPPTTLEQSLFMEILTSVSPTLIALQVLAVAGCVLGLRRGRQLGDPAMSTVAVTALVLYAWTMIIANAGEYGENDRFAVEIWPAVIVPAALALEFAARRVAHRRPSRGGPTRSEPRVVPKGPISS